MHAFQPLNIYQAPLSGLTLIEAGAGTGKTWTITGLYLRLLLQQGLTVEQILVVTYTKAATAELHERIRVRLADMLAMLQTGVSKDEFCDQLLQILDTEQRGSALARLTRAISGFDEAAIFTIHGFCQRALTDYAFEAGSGFEQELLPDERDLLREVVDDFWRREMSLASGGWVDFLAAGGQSPDVWLAEIAPHVGKSYLQVVDFSYSCPLGEDNVRVNATDLSMLGWLSQAPLVLTPTPLPQGEGLLRQVYAQAQSLWLEEREDILALLLAGDLDGTKYRVASLPKWGAALDEYFAAGTAGLVLPDSLHKLTPEVLAAAVKKGRQLPVHAFFDACAALIETVNETAALFNAKLAASKAALLAWCNAELPRRKIALQALSYNDLLNRLAEALDAEHGEHLAQGLRERYRAALIDEFQDTDPVQYRIFQRVYYGSEQPVFFVGDPKQAIYSFRGADVYSYLEARDRAARRYTLDTNQRSVPQLITAVNTVFGGHAAPFMLQDIDYRNAAASTREKPLLRMDDEKDYPFRFVLLPPQANGKAWPKDKAAEMAADATAVEIARLLGFQSLSGGDIAVLVSTHHQARRVELALRRLGVASVRQGQDNVYASYEALELERVLLAVAEPVRESLVKAALATELMGWRGETIFALQADEVAWEQQLERFHRYHGLWRDHGFMPMLRAWLDESGVAERLLALADGERRLTNLLHLAELLQVESHARSGLDALLGWFGRKLHSPERGEEAALLRLESDAERVKIVTLHTSKGLEYPVVFCPFLWDGSLLRKNETSFAYHDAERRPMLAFQADDTVRACVSQERLAEKIRLLYVALTRAKQRCYVVWGQVLGMEFSALFWLLHRANGAEQEQQSKALDYANIQAELQQRVMRAPEAMCLVDAVMETAPCPINPTQHTELTARPFSRGQLPPSWRMTSFSALSAGRHSEAPDYDAASNEPSLETATSETIFTFPRGANAGTCLHTIFESWEFTSRERPALEQLVSRKLKQHAIEERWTAVVADMLTTVLDTPLDGAELRLNRVPPEQRLVELEFTFALQDLQVQRLRELLAIPAYGLTTEFIQASQQLAFEAVRGYMKGFIDLVFRAGPHSSNAVGLNSAEPSPAGEGWGEENKNIVYPPRPSPLPDGRGDGNTSSKNHLCKYPYPEREGEQSCYGFDNTDRYYIVDWKSNWLGTSPANYAPLRLVQAVAREHYYLQYLIYCLALHRYLKLRQPDYDYERHFGGVYYLFLRGIHPSFPGAGIHADRPSAALINALDDLFSGNCL